MIVIQAMLTRKSTGFTLVELLINLSILSVLLLLATPLAIQEINNMKDRQFLNQFSHDIIYVQSIAINGPDYNPRLRIKQDEYSIHLDLLKPSVTQRKIPNGGHMHSDRLTSISFTKNGTIRKSGTITITLSSGTYLMVIPPGKGREHIVKQ